MANKDANPSNNKVPIWNSEMQRKLVEVKIEESELDPIKNSSKKQRTASMAVRSSPPTDSSPELFPSVDGVWRGNVVGKEAKKLLEAVEHQYPNTFQGLQIRGKPIWVKMLKELHLVIKRFMETSVDVITKEDITSFEEDLNDFKGFGFDLSWAHKRLDMVNRLKFGNEPLHKEFVCLEESLEPLRLRVGLQWKQLMEAHDMWKRAQLEYDNATNARDKKVEEMVNKFGAEFDRVLKGNLGSGMLPGTIKLTTLELNEIFFHERFMNSKASRFWCCNKLAKILNKYEPVLTCAHCRCEPILHENIP
ncbi:hypothetical protein LXL04_032349 [Taraxacum kok-saghyz]